MLEVSNAETHGNIFVRDGQIIHAQAGDLTGEEAFNRLMGLTGGQFHLKPFVEPPTTTISGSWEFLLMEAARQRDEAQESDAQSTAGPESGLPLDELDTDPQTAAAMAKRLQVGKSAAALADNFCPTIDEVLICSTQGDVLYEWQCADANARIRFLQFLSQKSWQMRQGLPIGYFQRLEIESPRNRIVTRIDADRALFVRASREPLTT